jgi:hypothetical protein
VPKISSPFIVELINGGIIKLGKSRISFSKYAKLTTELCECPSATTGKNLDYPLAVNSL